MKASVSAVYRQAEDLNLIELEDLIDNLICLKATKSEQEEIFEEKPIEDDEGNNIGAYGVPTLREKDLDFIQD